MGSFQLTEAELLGHASGASAIKRASHRGAGNGDPRASHPPSKLRPITNGAREPAKLIDDEGDYRAF
jgi:hypothetical protein